MASRHEIERRNLESSLLFMQQEHSNTLRALHEEISKLQKRCTGMIAVGLDIALDTGYDVNVNI